MDDKNQFHAKRKDGLGCVHFRLTGETWQKQLLQSMYKGATIQTVNDTWEPSTHEGCICESIPAI